MLSVITVVLLYLAYGSTAANSTSGNGFTWTHKRVFPNDTIMTQVTTPKTEYHETAMPITDLPEHTLELTVTWPHSRVDVTTFGTVSNKTGEPTTEEKTEFLSTISIERCPADCTCSAHTLLEELARVFYINSGNILPTVESEEIPTNYTHFRNKILIPALVSKFGNEYVKLWTSMYRIILNCTVTKKSFLIDAALESYFDFLDLKRAIFDMTLNCSRDSQVIWNSTEISPNRIHMEGCLNITVLQDIKTAVFLQKLYLNNSSSDWINTFQASSETYTVGVIDIRNFPLGHLPKLLQSDLNLQVLRLINLNLKQFDCEMFGQQSKISDIILTSNQLRRLERCFFPTHLNYLNVSFNSISDLSVIEFPNYVSGYNVSIMDLCSNNISTLNPFTILDVDELYLCRNSINAIRRLTFVQLSDLTILDLSHNQITHIEAGSFRFLYYLDLLDLSHNLLMALSPETGPANPSIINISYNKLHHPPFHSRNYEVTTAIRVEAHHNPFYCDCELPVLQAFVNNGQDRELYKIFAENSLKLSINESFPEELFTIADLKCVFPRSLRGMNMMSVVFNDSCPVVQDCPDECACYARSDVVWVDCSGQKLHSLPSVMPQGRLYLNFSYNELSSLPQREYLSRSYNVDLSHNEISEVSPTVFDNLTGSLSLALNDNRLKTLPENWKDVIFQSNSSIFLRGNPWVCDCENVWVAEWLKKNQEIVPNFQAVFCGYPDSLKGQALHKVTFDTLNCHLQSYVEYTVVLGCLGLIVLLAIPVLYRYRLETKVLLHAKFNVRPFDGKVVENEGKRFDTFISYSSCDEYWVIGVLVPRLETHRPPFNFCIHHRDFTVGEAIADNIEMATTSSRSTIIVLSKNFVESEWCIYEFQKAHHEMLQNNRFRLVAIILDDLCFSDLPADLKAYLKTNTFLTIEDRWFWKKLMYALPDPCNQQHECDQCHEIVEMEIR